MIELESRVPLPEGLAEMPPGPKLAAVLASIDRSRLCGFDLVVLLQARNRQLAYEQAEMAADMVAVTACVRRESSTSWEGEIDKYATAEVAAALTFTRRSASARLKDAHLLLERLPAVFRALRAGMIDWPRAQVLVDGTLGVAEEPARAVVARVLPEAPDLTTGQLAYRLRKLVLEADPEAAKRRYEEGVRERKVVRGTNRDGTGYLSGCNLPIERAAAADERLDALARAAKRAGDARPMDHIRTDIYLGLIDGTYQGPAPVGRRGVIELTPDLPTLLGPAERTGELGGWGPVIADIARQIAAERATPATGTAGHPDYIEPTVWRFSITDPLTGALRHHGTTRPPTTPSKPVSKPVSRSSSKSASSPSNGPSSGPVERERDPRRFPTKRQREFVTARDRTCCGPGCRVPARRSEIDHRIDHAHGGPTEVSNLDAKCASCHDLKDGGWTNTRNAFNDNTWTSLLGHRYHVPATPITEPQRQSVLEELFFKAVRKQM